MRDNLFSVSHETAAAATAAEAKLTWIIYAICVGKCFTNYNKLPNHMISDCHFLLCLRIR